MAIPRVAIVAPPPLPVAAAAGGGLAGIGNAAFGANMVFELAGRVLSAVSGFFSGFEGAITVQVMGGPEADIRRVWYLALSAAFGRYRNRVRDRASQIAYQATWDVTGKACQVEIVYTCSNTNQGLFGSGKPVAFQTMQDTIVAGDDPGVRTGFFKLAFVNPGDSVYQLIQRGPEQLTIGASLPHWLQERPSGSKPRAGDGSPLYPGLPCVSGATPKNLLTISALTASRRGVYREWPIGIGGLFAQYPYAVQVTNGRPARRREVVVNFDGDITLPDDGRVITTAEKLNPDVQPPQPPLDGSSRSSLLALVAQRLMSPCVLPASPPCTPVKTGVNGEQLYFPGIKDWDDQIAISKLAQAKRNDPTVEIPAGGQHPVVNKVTGADGYPVQTPTVFNAKD